MFSFLNLIIYLHHGRSAVNLPLTHKFMI